VIYKSLITQKTSIFMPQELSSKVLNANIPHIQVVQAGRNNASSSGKFASCKPASKNHLPIPRKSKPQLESEGFIPYENEGRKRMIKSSSHLVFVLGILPYKVKHEMEEWDYATTINGIDVYEPRSQGSFPNHSHHK
jgi:hypothetical protein